MSCVFEDNEGAAQLAQDPIHTSNSKHVAIRRHFFREFVFRGEFDIISVESETRETFCFHRDFLMDI